MPLPKRNSTQLIAVLCIAAPLALPATAPAQIVRGDLALSGGIATDQRGVRSSAVTLAPSVLLQPDPRFVAGLSLSGTQFEDDVRAMGGTGTLITRIPIGARFALGGL